MALFEHPLRPVVAGLVPAIHVLAFEKKAWMPGTKAGHDDLAGHSPIFRPLSTEQVFEARA
jgi:hypothetical protein